MLKDRLIFLGIALALMAYIGVTSPDIKFPLMLHKLSLVTIAAVVGYFLDVILFPKFRPHLWQDNITNFQQIVSSILIRRAIIIAAMVLGVSMGV